jgi:hypothetical protein
MNGESALCYLGQVLYRPFDLGFYIVVRFFVNPSRLPPLILSLLLLKVLNKSTRSVNESIEVATGLGHPGQRLTSLGLPSSVFPCQVV